MNELDAGRSSGRPLILVACTVTLALSFLLYFSREPVGTAGMVLRVVLVVGIAAGVVANVHYAFGTGRRLNGGTLAGFQEYRTLVKRTEGLIAATPSVAVTVHTVLGHLYGPILVVGLFVSVNWLLLGILLFVLDSYLSFLLFQPPKIVLLTTDSRHARRFRRRLRRAMRPNRVLAISRTATSHGGLAACAADAVWETIVELAAVMCPNLFVLADPEDPRHVDGVMRHLGAIGRAGRARIIDASDATVPEANAIGGEHLLELVRAEGWSRQPVVSTSPDDGPDGVAADRSASEPPSD
jgi:hypothetical protein